MQPSLAAAPLSPVHPTALEGETKRGLGTMITRSRFLADFLSMATGIECERVQIDRR